MFFQQTCIECDLFNVVYNTKGLIQNINKFIWFEFLEAYNANKVEIIFSLMKVIQGESCADDIAIYKKQLISNLVKFQNYIGFCKNILQKQNYIYI